jgi:hypothetical protein
MLTPLISVPASKPVNEPEVGGLVTVKLAGDVTSGGRIARIAYGTYFVKLVGLNVPQPYELGMIFPLNREAIIDW